MRGCSSLVLTDNDAEECVIFPPFPSSLESAVCMLSPLSILWYCTACVIYPTWRLGCSSLSTESDLPCTTYFLPCCYLEHWEKGGRYQRANIGRSSVLLKICQNRSSRIVSYVKVRVKSKAIQVKCDNNAPLMQMNGALPSLFTCIQNFPCRSQWTTNKWQVTYLPQMISPNGANPDEDLWKCKLYITLKSKGTFQIIMRCVNLHRHYNNVVGSFNKNYIEIA